MTKPSTPKEMPIRLITQCGCERTMSGLYPKPSIDIPIKRRTEQWDLEYETILQDDIMVRRFDLDRVIGGVAIYRESCLAKFADIERDPSFIEREKKRGRAETLTECIALACGICRLGFEPYRKEVKGGSGWFHKLEHPNEGVENRPCQATYIRRVIEKEAGAQ